jgi:hypothetical protein
MGIYTCARAAITFDFSLKSNFAITFDTAITFDFSHDSRLLSRVEERPCATVRSWDAECLVCDGIQPYSTIVNHRAPVVLRWHVQLDHAEGTGNTQ